MSAALTRCSAPPSAEVIPFPPARRAGMIRKHAVIIASYRPDAGERHLERLVETQRASMLAKGVDPARVEAECEAFRGALKAALWRVVLSGGAA